MCTAAYVRRQRDGCAPAAASLIWIDASTYLVVQTEHFLPGSNMTWSPSIDHVTWRSPPEGTWPCSQ